MADLWSTTWDRIGFEQRGKDIAAALEMLETLIAAIDNWSEQEVRPGGNTPEEDRVINANFEAYRFVRAMRKRYDPR